MENLSGKTIKGYELRERIGTGGFGAVYKAHQSTVGREVAIKIILPGFANHPDFIRRFESEAQLVARLEHPYITPLYDYWRDPDGAYLVMRWLRGGSLRDALQNGSYDLPSTALVLDQISGALALAHRSEVIHRDLKPGNVLLDEDGNAYLADFGIAKDLASLNGNKTQADAIVGSLEYLSPEQARAEPVTPRTDIYSLGVMLYEMMSGHHPFHGISAVDILYKHINDPLPPLKNLDPSVADSVNAVIQKATAKNPSHRYPDALALAAEFREAAGLNRTSTSGNVVEILTQREQEVLQLIIDGHSNKEIAQDMTVTLGTVKWYVNQIYAKLRVRNRVQAIVRARELNLIVRGTLGEYRVNPDASVSISNLPEPENPYKGLHAFQPADHRDFFGREELVTKLLERIAGHTHFLAVIGPSGSGKSSLVKAGLIPALWRGDLPGSEKWFVVEMLPGAYPIEKLEIALTRVAANQSGNLHDQLKRDARGLMRVADLILPNDNSELVLVIDQFEEVFTLVEDEAERAHFLDLLHTAVTNPRSRVRVVMTLRADFYDRPLYYPEFGELVRSHMETVLPLSAKGLERAIAGPAERVGMNFEPGLVASIVSEMNYQAGALPLLQYALTELFEHREGRLLTHKAYQEIGGAVGALAKRADELYLSLTDADKEAARQMFLRLVTLGEGTEDTRRRVARSELLSIGVDNDLMEELIDTYATYRLLSLDNDSGTRAPTVEVAHEAILREWERLRAWLNDSRDDIKLQRQLSHAADDWRVNRQDASFLLTGSRLQTFEKWAGETQLALTPREREFLQVSLEERTRQAAAEQTRQEREQRLERRSQTFLRGLVGVLLLATLGAFGLTGFAFSERDNARRSAAEAQNVALINGSQAALANGSVDQAIALAIEAVILEPKSARAQVALSEAAYAPGTIHVFEGHTDAVDVAVFSPDGRTALSASWDKTLILWDIQTGALLRRFEGHTDDATSVAFLPDGQTAISGSADKTLIQWNLQTGAAVRRFEGQPDRIWTVAVSPDGLYAVSGGSEGNIILWDIQTGDIIRRFEGHTAGVETVEFSADGSQLLSGSNDKTIILWDVATRQIVRRFEGHAYLVFSAVFSPDGRTILSSSDDSWAFIWDIETGQILHRFSEGGPGIMDVAYSPDGRTILTGGVAGITLWNIETAQPISRLRGHTGFIDSVVFSADGRTALSASFDNTLRLWDLHGGQVIHRLNSEGTKVGLAASPDGQKAFTIWELGSTVTVILWDLNTGEEIRRASSSEAIYSIAFSPDGQTALFGTGRYYDGSPADLILQDVNTGEEIRRFTGHPTGVSSVAFSPDGNTAASADWNGVLIVWDVATGQQIRRFDGYAGAEAFVQQFSPDGQTLVVIPSNGVLSLWDSGTGKEIRGFEGHTEFPSNFVFSSDGKRGFSGSNDTTAILWDVASGAVLRRFTDHSGPIPGVAMTDDGQLGFAGSTDKTSLLWDLNTGEVLRLYHINPWVADFAPDNRTALIAIHPTNSIELWRIDVTLDELLTWTRGNRYVPELTCQQRELYRLEPLCEASPLSGTTGSE